MEVRGYFFRIDRKGKILIVNFLDKPGRPEGSRPQGINPRKLSFHPSKKISLKLYDSI